MNALIMVAAQSVFAAVVSQASGEKPQALLYAEQARNEVVSAEIEYSVQTSGGTKFKNTRLFGGDLLAVDLGNEDGWTNSADGSMYSHSRVFCWQTSDGDSYRYLDGWVTMPSTPPDRPSGSSGGEVYDFRTLGLETSPILGRTVGQYEKVDAEVARYEVHDVGEGIVEVRCIGTTHPDLERVWRLDSNKGYRPVVVQQVLGGEVLEEARSYYDDSEGVSVLPSRVEYSGEHIITKQIDVYSATINEPYHREITFADFPLLAGVQLYGPKGQKAWDGESFVPAAEFSARVGSGDIDARQFMKAARAMSFDTSPPPFSSPESRGGLVIREADSAKPKMWAPYVRVFLAKHRAQTEVRKLAWRIHKECLEAAQEFVEQRDDVKKPDSQAGQVEIAKLEGIVTKIFESHLKPGLQKLVD